MKFFLLRYRKWGGTIVENVSPIKTSSLKVKKWCENQDFPPKLKKGSKIPPSKIENVLGIKISPEK